ncbi:MAG TPA: exodeoxyribonuclease VII large subunit [Xanthomonadaceae bacterium]|jgi:exodeoxyribonuclease VII large subunit|nr:exodeoxyribonuclease VII large subunit [Xanthomonadaceae bacterium]
MDLTAPARNVLTPSQLGALARDLLEGSFPMVWVEGELGGVSKPASGHLYFNLKDARAQLRCAMFRPKSQYLRFAPRDGVQVLVRGRLTVYEARGDLQLIVDHMEEAGEGALRRAFDELKARLAAEGLFDAARKRALPRFVRRLGVITSPSGAAVRDVLHVLQRRFPLIDVEVVAVPVQGAAAAPAIVQALRWAGASGRYDALLLTRGGGSLEDLWCFNDEAVARAIVASPLPVVSGVGHEIDTTLADFAADLRAPTPSAAAEMLVPDRAELLAMLHRQRARLDESLRRRLDAPAQRADRAWLRLQALSPHTRLERGATRLLELRRRLDERLLRPLAQRQERMGTLAARLRLLHPRMALRLRHELLAREAIALQRNFIEGLAHRRLHLRGVARALDAVSPLATLRRGFAILHEADGTIVRSVAQTHAGQELSARLADGSIGLKVEPPK